MVQIDKNGNVVKTTGFSPLGAITGFLNFFFLLFTSFLGVQPTSKSKPIKNNSSLGSGSRISGGSGGSSGGGGGARRIGNLNNIRPMPKTTTCASCQ